MDIDQVLICRPAETHDWQPLPGDANYVSCTRCGRLDGFQRGGLLGNQGRLRMYNYPEIEAQIRERAARTV